MSNDASSISILLDLAPDGVCLASDIAAPAGGLLHPRFTLAVCPKTIGNALLCCTMPSGRPAQPLAGIMLCGVRTFLTLRERKARSSRQLDLRVIV